MASRPDSPSPYYWPCYPQALGGPPNQLTAVKTGQVAAGFSAPPIFLDQVKNRALRIVVRGSTLAEYKQVAIRVNFANTNYIRSHPDVVRRFLQAEQTAWQWIFANHDESVALWREKAGLRQDPEFLKSVFDFYTPPMTRLSPLGGRERILEDARSFGFLPGPLSPKQQDEVFDLQYVPKP